MKLDYEKMKDEIYQGQLRRSKTSAIQRVVILNASEIKELGVSAGELTHKLDLPFSYMTEINKMLALHDELSSAGYQITKLKKR